MESSELKQLIRSNETCDFFPLEVYSLNFIFAQRNIKNKINSYTQMNTSEGMRFEFCHWKNTLEKLGAPKRGGPGFKFTVGHIYYGTLGEFLYLLKPPFLNL